MGVLQNGQWLDKWYDTDKTGGAFKRQESSFRGWLSASGDSGFKAEAGRYHLYVSLACPWAHRTLIFRALKGLQDIIDVTVVEPLMLENGWQLQDPLYGCEYLYQLYLKANADYEGRVTVPVLWDKKTETIVSNESADIIRMFNSEFNGLTGNTDDYYPAPLRDEIDAINADVYSAVNNGVYKAGFATRQSVYDHAFEALFNCLDQLDQRLSQQRYLVGDQITEADWRLFTTLIRFDAVYVGHFKCNRRRIADYKALDAYLRDLYQRPGIADTVDFDHIKQHYYGSHKTLNPSGLVPLGPDLELLRSHRREVLSASVPQE